MSRRLKVVIVKPSKYSKNGYVDRFKTGYMPNATLPHMRSLTPGQVGGTTVEIHSIDEYVQTDLSYLRLLERSSDPTLLALVGVQSNQFHRALDLAAYAKSKGMQNCIIGGPHAMTCDTLAAQGRGISFSLSEAETVWTEILEDAEQGELKPIYGDQRRWQPQLPDTVIQPPARADLDRYIIPMLGLAPVRGCPYTCNFCSVIKISGRQVRSGSIESTMQSLRLARAGGVEFIMFTSDNFNKYADAPQLLQAMIDEKLKLRFFVQCDTQIARQEQLVQLLGKAGCFQMFVGVESFDRKTLLGVHKAQNQPAEYGRIVELCRQNGIMSHLSNIIGFPQDTLKSIDEHVDILCELNPDVCTFWNLTPIPGTEQYRDFMREGLLHEPNLDRYDCTCPTWHHPTLSPDVLDDAMYGCYRRFFTARHFADYVRRNFELKSPKSAKYSLFPMFIRYWASKKRHPMSGGVGRVSLDTDADYRALRRQTYDFDLAPLPACLELSKEDEAINRQAKLAVAGARA